jgi:hypothetical protein
MTDGPLGEPTNSQLAAKIDDLSREFRSAFVGGDHHAHRMEHEAAIAAAKAQEDFWRDLRTDLIKKGLWSVILIVCGLVVYGMAAKLGIRP